MRTSGKEPVFIRGRWLMGRRSGPITVEGAGGEWESSRWSAGGVTYIRVKTAVLTLIYVTPPADHLLDSHSPPAPSTVIGPDLRPISHLPRINTGSFPLVLIHTSSPVEDGTD